MATMAVDTRQQPQLSAMYDPLRQAYAVPHFNNPWTTTNQTSAASPPAHLYSTSQAPVDGMSQQRPSTIALPFPSLHPTSSPIAPGTSYLTNPSYSTSPIDASQDLKQAYVPQYTAAPSASYMPTSAPSYPIAYYPDRSSYAAYDASVRRASQSTNMHPRGSFSDAVEASRGILAMSSSDITPRPLYGAGSSRSSTDSYGFPSTHSAHSSISSASSYHPSYYNPSVAESVVSDYSSASESVDLNSRTLPRPVSLIGGIAPPNPQTMMGQFSSKITTNTQKKHKCKICDKRFTRPSSLQTHMYSHTGEKPFACEVEGCGRHFSVVSNLRRHRKVHKSDGQGGPASPDEEEEQ